MKYNRCGKTSQTPGISLGFWHNFGGVDTRENSRAMARHAFDLVSRISISQTITALLRIRRRDHGYILKNDLSGYRDELIISTKADTICGWTVRRLGSRKFLMASLDQSLKRMDSTMSTYSIIIGPIRKPRRRNNRRIMRHRAQRQGSLCRSLQLSSGAHGKAEDLMKSMGMHILIHQPKYSMFERWIEDGLLKELRDDGIGCIVFSPLAQGLLTNKYLEESRGLARRKNRQASSGRNR